MSDSLFSSTDAYPAIATVMEALTPRLEASQAALANVLSDHLSNDEGKHPTITCISWAQQFPAVAAITQSSGTLACVDYSTDFDEHFAGHDDGGWSRFIGMLCTLPRSRREQIAKMIIGFEKRQEL